MGVTIDKYHTQVQVGADEYLHRQEQAVVVAVAVTLVMVVGNNRSRKGIGCRWRSVGAGLVGEKLGIENLEGRVAGGKKILPARK